ncbi:glycosyltransferase family 39 protein [Paraburkholderia fungorum]|uniref:glycosyltransferase family 39 protein n=1 Tax=Paraburkholderia fungorum TaxID=134537 RepID=UPI002098400A|nr:glycosyltransferase family 39 protein [Paraburkholderia fungorum]USX09458.1 glycosyltransferase family 39 protein [Paraburkholderia fungorum]
MKQLRKEFSGSKYVFFDVKLVTRLAAFLAVVMLGVSAWLALEYRNTPILGFHAFRQTQTALTSYWACHGGFHVAYWTPVGGYPWSIPFEFPIYQWIVSLVACPLGLDLDPVGRLVSYVFWLACLAPAFRICRRLFGAQAPLYFWVFSALFLATPLYLFWGRSFLMESAALFFSLYFVAFSLELIRGDGSWVDAVLAGGFLALAILQKSTTVLPLLILAPLYLWRAWPDLRKHWMRSPMLWKGIAAYVIPFLIGVAWVKYSDHVKMANPFGQFLTSKALSAWNFGTLDGRVSEGLWVNVIWNRVIGENVAGHLGVFLIIAGLAFARGRRSLILWGIGLFLLFFMVFENLLFVHDYYPISNTVYLVFALAVAIGGLVEERPKFAVFASVAMVGVIAINLHGYFAGHLFEEESRPYDDSYPILAVAKFIREHTSPNDPVLVYGDDWSSQIPYYGQRRAFVVPHFFVPYLGPLDNPERYLNRGPGAILVCGAARTETDVTQKISANYPTWPKAGFEMCDIYLRGG